MTLSTTASREPNYTGNGVTTVFPFNFRVFQSSDLTVIQTDTSGNETTLVEGTDYTVSGVGSYSGGSVTTTVAVPNLYKLSILRVVDLTQPTSITNQGAFYAKTHEDVFDRLTMIDQQQENEIKRAIKLPKSIDTDMELDPPVEGTVLGWVGGVLKNLAAGTASLAANLLDSTNVALGDALVAVKQPFTGAVARTQHNKNADEVWVSDFAAAGTIGTGNAANDTAALKAAIAYAAASKNETINVPHGTYYLNDKIIVPTGIMIVCPGSQGSTSSRGTVFYHQSNLDCFVWDATGTDFMGTGGGLKNALVLKYTGFSGGSGIKVYCTSDNKRPGEMVFENVMVAANTGEGLWARGLEVDGTNCNTPGARGARHIHLRKFRVSGCTVNNEYILLNQVTHFFAQGLAIDTGTGTGTVGMTIKGINDGIFINGGDLAASITIIANDASNATTNFHYDGKVGGSFTNNDTAITGTCRFSELGGIVSKSKLLRIIADKPIFFSAQHNANTNDVTGDGTVYQVSFDTENIDNYGNWGTNTFTCTVAGTYIFDWGVHVAGLTSSHTRIDVGLVQAGSLTKSHQQVSNPWAINASGNAGFNGSSMFDLAYGDTVILRVAVTGGTKVADITGTAGTQYTHIEGKYIA